ncbi:MAG: cellulase family glycosylhydrolase [Halothece sp.]
MINFFPRTRFKIIFSVYNQWKSLCIFRKYRLQRSSEPLRNFGQWFVLGLLLSLFIFFGLPKNAVNSGAPPSSIQLPLSTRGAQIVDATGNLLILRGVNWFGIETETHSPHGLWERDYKEMLSQIKQLGYNLIRLPYSVQALQDENVTAIDYSIGSNQELEGKTPLEVMDAVIEEAGKQGLLILLDSHRLNNKRIPELWYGDGFSEADWINAWQMLAERYKNQPNVIGADLKNEPHGKASWGTNDPKTDWRLAAERAGNAILAINPDWLIVVEGVENNVPGQKLSIHWMGANLEGVRKYPVRLSAKDKLVYSVHEYGPGVYEQPWFSEPDFPDNLYERWDIGFHYIVKENIAPVFIGEFGGRQVDTVSTEGTWQRTLVDFINQEKLSFAYWSWNPNSEDTGGILQDDWKTVNAEKQTLLSQILPSDSTPPSFSPVPPIAVTPTLASNDASRLTAEADIHSDWQTGFCVGMRVTNPQKTALSNWRVTFEMKDAKINHLWNGKVTSEGSQYRIEPPQWASILQPNETVHFGFCADKLGLDYKPKAISAFSL